MPKKALFITFEGPEGAGKTTQIKLLQEYLDSIGKYSIITREPGGTEVAEQLREIVKHHTGDEKIADETEVLLFAASRAQHVNHLIIPTTEKGTTVICDRFSDSTIAYQGYARGQDLKLLTTICDYASSYRKPDLTLLLDLSPEDGFTRTAKREETQGKADRIEAEALEFHHAVRNGFLELAKQEPERIKVVNAMQDIETLHKEIKEIVNDAFGRI